MTDPLKSIAEDKGPVGPATEMGGGPGPEGAPGTSMGPSFGQRLGTLFLPCPEDPMVVGQGGISRFVNQRLAERAGLEPGVVFVGENVAHCLNHLFPGGGSLGWPPIVNLFRSWMDYRDKAARELAPDQPAPRPGP